MEVKRNLATKNRPKGDRVLDAPVLLVDIVRSINQLKEENAWIKNDRNGMTVFKSPGLAVVLVMLKADASITKNMSDGVLVVKVHSGHIRVRIEMPTSELEVRKDQMIILHPHVEYSIIALKESVVLLTTNSGAESEEDDEDEVEEEEDIIDTE